MPAFIPGVLRSRPKAGRGRFRFAAKVEVIVSGSKKATAVGEIAWILATHTDAKVRDPAQAVRLAERAAELTSRRDPVILDALAGDIAKRLALYRVKQPYREPAGARPETSR